MTDYPSFEAAFLKDRKPYRYPVISYSVNKRNAVYSYEKVGFWRRLLNLILRKKPEKIFEGYHYESEICLCKEALDYFTPASIIQIRQKQWYVEARGESFLNVRTIEPTRQLIPINIGDLTFLVCRAFVEGGIS